MGEVLSKVSCDHIPEGDSCGLVVTLIEQNAKLRELIKDLYEDMWASGEWLEPYEQRMRELGVEVD